MFLCLFLACVGLLVRVLCAFLDPAAVSLAFLLYGLLLALAVALAFLELEAEGAFFLYGGIILFVAVVGVAVTCVHSCIGLQLFRIIVVLSEFACCGRVLS